ncbi:ABC transporter substrate-binding protein [Glycomyces halotolerans]
MKRRVFAAVLAFAGTSALAACSSDDPLSSGSDGGDGETIVIGSQDYYSNEIIAEIYAQALEEAGYTVDRQFRIGQREAYLPEIEEGRIDLFPEYTGPLLQYWNPDTEATKADEVYAELSETVPDGLRVLDQSAANDQDSYTVTREFAEEWDLTEIGDLADVTVPLVLGANSEAENRAFGPEGMMETYGIEIGFTPIEDGGGPLTVKALQDGDIQLAVIYTASPSLTTGDLVTLEDTEGLFLASNVVPLASDNVDEEAAAIVNDISASMDTEDLVALNVRSVEEELPASVIAADWLAEHSS